MSEARPEDKAPEKTGIIGVFVRHPTAANLLMMLMVMAGYYAVQKLNTQFFPSMNIPSISIKVVWPGASAADVEANILQVMEPSLRFLDGVDNASSLALEGAGSIILEFQRGADMEKAMSDVEQAVAGVTNLPEDAEKPVIQKAEFYENVAMISVSGPFEETVIRNYAKKLRDGLLDAGIDRVQFNGLRKEEIRVELREKDMARLNITPADIAGKIRDNTTDMPSGTLDGEAELQIRALGSGRSLEELGAIEIKSGNAGDKILLRDVATLRTDFRKGALIGLQNGQPAIELSVKRALTADTLKTLGVLRKYLEEMRPTLPPTLHVKIYNITGERVTGRLWILISNGLQGLVLVLVVLFIFLNARIAFWVAFGIPVAIMATLGVMLVSGQTINMVSMFALIMMLGIIVDDAIVVGEHAATLKEEGMGSIHAAEYGASRMYVPVLAATLTTQAAFLPILLIRDRMGDIMGAIPLVVMAVLLASLVECFLILPGHLRHALHNIKDKPGLIRGSFDRALNWFRDGPYNAFASFCFHWRYSVVAISLAAFILAVGLWVGGRISLRFFPSPESERIMAYVTFAPGLPRERQAEIMSRIEKSLEPLEQQLTGGREKIFVSAFSILGKAGRTQGENLAQIFVQLSASEVRTVRTKKIMRVWRKNLPQIAGVERLTLTKSRAGPGGKDIDIRLQDAPIEKLKEAALELREKLAEFPGLTAIDDDLPYGKPELVLELTPRGRALGFTTSSVGTQVRNAFEGVIANRFTVGDDEITVRVLRKQELQGREALERLYLVTPARKRVPLSEVVRLKEKSGFSIVQRKDGLRTVSVVADVNTKFIEVPQVIEKLQETIMPALSVKYDLKYSFSGKAEERKKSFEDLRLGALISLIMIYIILAWVFSSYTMPLAVMSIIPFGFVGALYGHVIMGHNLSIISLIALLGLSGILVNDSIILVVRFQERLREGDGVAQAAVGASRDRLRAVMLTSLTTIGGLLPLLFEHSRQAQFLIPMVITLVFGLAVATLLVLVLVPSVLGIGYDLKRIFGGMLDLYFPSRLKKRAAGEPAGQTMMITKPDH